MLAHVLSRQHGARVLSSVTQRMSSTSNAALRRQLASPESLEGLQQKGWIVASGPGEGTQKLTRDYKFPNFIEAWGFMSRVAIWAEKLNVSARRLRTSRRNRLLPTRCTRVSLTDDARSSSITPSGRMSTIACQSRSRPMTKATVSRRSTSKWQTGSSNLPASKRHDALNSGRTSVQQVTETRRHPRDAWALRPTALVRNIGEDKRHTLSTT